VDIVATNTFVHGIKKVVVAQTSHIRNVTVAIPTIQKMQNLVGIAKKDSTIRRVVIANDEL